jgi:hypothetical protein
MGSVDFCGVSKECKYQACKLVGNILGEWETGSLPKHFKQVSKRGSYTINDALTKSMFNKFQIKFEW